MVRCTYTSGNAPLDIYPQDGYSSRTVDLKLTLLCLQVIAERGIADVYVPQWLGVLGTLKVVQMAPSWVKHKPATLEAPQWSLSRELGQVSGKPGCCFSGGLSR